MNYSDIMALVHAGFNAQQIGAMYAASVAAPAPVATAPAFAPAAPAPATAIYSAAPAFAPAASAAQMFAANIATAAQPAPVPVEDTLAAIMFPGGGAK